MLDLTSRMDQEIALMCLAHRPPWQWQ